jgi:hypothetical protein
MLHGHIISLNMLLLFLYFFSGFKPFVEACIDAGQKLEAVKYILKLTNSAEKSEV